jgi:hypothetical protein
MMADRWMDAVEVYVSENDMVVIKQDSARLCQTSYIHLHPDQIETVIRWLEEAKTKVHVSF